ncbi:sulfurtransferase [Salipiger sp. PrR002]|uniref:sulfurtransferase n=1 Tax=Salipiger sp. PrR002 TaxID=2706489 RepID=UPI0013BA52F3|nr:sulfurtransferase [Salipiger sp. PrR002]NDW01886.1 sulfurtransferase [Salipiger sp. PrR002]NDW59084.1 sulfurtransferase [Salipiger sp. PrR004]
MTAPFIDPLIDPAELTESLDTVVILDATYYHPPDPERSRRDVSTLRIPGAQLFEIDEIADTSAPLAHMMPDAERFAAAMAELGIDGTRPVVVYDRSAAHFSAPRVWYTLRLFGVPDVRVLNGGLARWRAEGYETASGALPEREPVARQSWTPELSRVLDGSAMADTVARGGAIILDARPEGRFFGRDPEPRAGLISGHMPGARSLPFTELTDAEGQFLAPEVLRERIGDGPERGTIVTCGSGMTACALALGLARIGREATLYDGSWAEWGTGDLGPITT